MKGLRGDAPDSARGGSALVLALLVVMVLAGLGTAFLLIANSASRRQAAETDNLRAFYLAEAGLAEAFQALRIGRSGQLASEAEPAVHGDGLLWVDATDTPDEQVRLTSTALCGSGRSSLALVVEPVDIPLGFFSDEDLVVESVLLVDGFDSEDATYEEEIGALFDLRGYADWLASIVGREMLVNYLNVGGSSVAQELARAAALDASQSAELVSLFPDLCDAYLAGTLFPPQYQIQPIDFDLAVSPVNDPIFGTGVVTQDTSTPSLGETVPDASPEVSSGELVAGTGSELLLAPLPAEHTDSGGLLSSNGSIIFSTSTGEPVEIHGDVIPGPGGSVEGLWSVQVSGDTMPRAAGVELPAVEVPPISRAAPIRHDELLPLLVAPGESGHERIEVAADAELILRGPATVVIGELVLEPGAVMTLDTRDGDVALYVTGGMDLQPGSVVTTSSDLPDELTIQVAEIPTGPADVPVRLEATSQFHGTIYAPDTEVHVGSAFEVYGGIVARRLELGAGARLHFDNSEYEGSPIPRVVSWQIVEIPSAIRNRRDDPYVVLDVTRGQPAALAEAHDLSSVDLAIEYVDQGGATRTYAGTEDLFDWHLVSQVLSIERSATRTAELPVDPPGETAAIEPSVRADFQAAIDGYPLLMNDKDLVDLLIPLSPLSPEEWAMFETKGVAGGQYGRLLSVQ